MRKVELVERVTMQTSLNRKEAVGAVDAVFSSIIESLAVGEKVELRGFGSFRIRKKNARIGRNPKIWTTSGYSAQGCSLFQGGESFKRVGGQCKKKNKQRA